MIFLLSNWKTILGMIATAALAYLLHTVDVDRIEAKQRAAIEDQKTTDKKSCDADKAITKGVSDDYQTKITALSGQLNALKRVQPTACVVVSAPRPTGGRNDTANPAKPTRQNGVTASALYDYAGEAERYRLQLSACQSFITQTWKEKGQ